MTLWQQARYVAIGIRNPIKTEYSKIYKETKQQQNDVYHHDR